MRRFLVVGSARWHRSQQGGSRGGACSGCGTAQVPGCCPTAQIRSADAEHCQALWLRNDGHCADDAWEPGCHQFWGFAQYRHSSTVPGIPIYVPPGATHLLTVAFEAKHTTECSVAAGEELATVSLAGAVGVIPVGDWTQYYFQVPVSSCNVFALKFQVDPPYAVEPDGGIHELWVDNVCVFVTDEVMGGLAAPSYVVTPIPLGFQFPLCGQASQCQGPICVNCEEDLDLNGVVDGTDLGVILGNWGNSGAGDLDCNGVVDGSDLGRVFGAWGPCG